MMEETVLMAWT